MAYITLDTLYTVFFLYNNNNDDDDNDYDNGYPGKTGVPIIVVSYGVL